MKLAWLGNRFAVGLIGLGIGWLLGMAVSPVIANVVVTIIGAAATLVAIMGGWRKREDESTAAQTTDEPNDKAEKQAEPTVIQQDIDLKKEVQGAVYSVAHRFQMTNPWPFALLMIGIIVGSSLGLQARNQARFGSSLSYEVNTWMDQGIPKEEVVRRLFEREHPYTPYAEPPLWLAMPLSITASTPITSVWITATQMLSSEVQMWESVGLDRKEIAKKLFELKYSVNATTTSAGGNQATINSRDIDKGAGLVGESAGNNSKLDEACGFLSSESWDKLKKSLRVNDKLPTLIEDVEIQNQLLSIILEPLCP